LKWENREDHFQAWIDGRTGFPIVDAGMRQLKQTGWMHNRVRMIVASFLTKDLLIDWRWGENYFMKTLLDGDLAPNNGGWQWAASTGVDSQPYFRIFNPTLQGKRFDPAGEYVRKFVPELRNISSSKIHEPVSPIVDHAVRSKRAIQLFKDARG
jgi:deoxyribodipyrimidine photo-lyase